MPVISSNLALLDERDHTWDASAAKGRIAKFASSDGSGDKDTIDWGKYQEAFFFKDSDDATNFGDYHLPFADVVDDELKAVWKGVTAAANAANGGRGASGYGDCKSEIEKYYKKFAKLFKDDTIQVPWADDRTNPAFEEFQRAFGEFGGVERRYAHIGGLQTRDNGDPDSLFSVSGQAIVFNRYSLDLGGFKEEIAPEAVREAMETKDADYHLLWDHDTTLVLARNRNGTLNAEIADEGVDFWGRVAKTSYAADLRVLMDRGDVDECSFAFTVAPGGEEWRMEDDGSIVRRVTKIERLWDLTICARGAYPQTHSASVRSFVAHTAIERAHNQGVTQIPSSEGRALQPGLVAWDDEQGYWDIQCDIEAALAQREDERFVYWWLIDLNVRDSGSEAIVCRYDCNDSSAGYYLVTGITFDMNEEPVLPENDTFQPVDTKWVAVATSGDDDDPDGAVMGEGMETGIMEMDDEDTLRTLSTRVAAVQGFDPRGLKIESFVEELTKRILDAASEDIEPVVEPEDVSEEEEETAAVEEEIEEAMALSEDDSDTDDEERKRKAALARARGRAALV